MLHLSWRGSRHSPERPAAGVTERRHGLALSYRSDVSPHTTQTFRRSAGPFAVLGVMVIGLLALTTAPAHAGPATSCASSAKAAFARVQLYKDPDCKGSSVIVGKTGDANRPNFVSFRNYDETIRNVDKSRSSLAIDAGTCVRLFDAVDYAGEASTNICAGSGVVFWNLDRFNDRARSMRVCPVSAPAQCNAAPAPAPAPTPPPAQAPLAGSQTGLQVYTLGTFNMAGGNPERGDKPGTADEPNTAHALSQSIKSRGADIVFLQEACKRMTDTLTDELGPDWTIRFQPTPKRKRDTTLPADREPVKNPKVDPETPQHRDPENYHCKKGDGSTGEESQTETTFGLGIVIRSSRLTLGRGRVHPLPPYKGSVRMLCFDIKTIVTQRPLVACSTHLTAGINTGEDSRRLQVKEIGKVLSPTNTAGKAVLLGGDFNMTPETTWLGKLSDPLNALWDPRYGFGAFGSFVEVDSGPRGPSPKRRTDGRNTWPSPRSKYKYDYIFVRDVYVTRADIGHSEFSDHKLLWATVRY